MAFQSGEEEGKVYATPLSVAEWVAIQGPAVSLGPGA
jgi:hypothetical protein